MIIVFMVCYNKTLQSMDYEKICRMIIVFMVFHNKALQGMDYDKTFKKRLTLFYRQTNIILSKEVIIIKIKTKKMPFQLKSFPSRKSL